MPYCFVLCLGLKCSPETSIIQSFCFGLIVRSSTPLLSMDGHKATKIGVFIHLQWGSIGIDETLSWRYRQDPQCACINIDVTLSISWRCRRYRRYRRYRHSVGVSMFTNPCRYRFESDDIVKICVDTVTISTI